MILAQQVLLVQVASKVIRELLEVKVIQVRLEARATQVLLVRVASKEILGLLDRMDWTERLDQQGLLALTVYRVIQAPLVKAVSRDQRVQQVKVVFKVILVQQDQRALLD